MTRTTARSRRWFSSATSMARRGLPGSSPAAEATWRERGARGGASRETFARHARAARRGKRACLCDSIAVRSAREGRAHRRHHETRSALVARGVGRTFLFARGSFKRRAPALRRADRRGAQRLPRARTPATDRRDEARLLRARRAGARVGQARGGVVRARPARVIPPDRPFRPPVPSPGTPARDLSAFRPADVATWTPLPPAARPRSTPTSTRRISSFPWWTTCVPRPPPLPAPPPDPPPLRASVIFRYSQPGTLRARASLGI